MCPQNAIYEVVLATPSRSPAVVASTAAVKAPEAVSLRTNRLAREQKAVAFTAILPAVTRVLLRLADLFISRYGRDLQTNGIGQGGYDTTSRKSGRGRHRWRGGS